MIDSKPGTLEASGRRIPVVFFDAGGWTLAVQDAPKDLPPGQTSRNLAALRESAPKCRTLGRGASTQARRQGFTLVELLTVIAIIAVLATLLSTALSSAKRKARQAACTSNLRQISLAFNMYMDDVEKRPPHLGSLVTSKYLPAPGALLCPEDKTRNWGGLVEGATASSSASAVSMVPAPPAAPAPVDLFKGPANAVAPIPYSYLHPMIWEDWAWDRLQKIDPSAGIAACQLHGLGKPNLAAPSVRDFQGLVLRAQKDGAVVRRQVFWAAVAGANTTESSPKMETARSVVDVTGASPPAAAAMFQPPAPPADYPWKLFTDEPVP